MRLKSSINLEGSLNSCQEQDISRIIKRSQEIKYHEIAVATWVKAGGAQTFERFNKPTYCP